MEKKTTFKDLNPKQKREYIWDYYKLHIIGSIVGVMFIGSIVSAMLKPAPIVHDADLLVSGNMFIEQEQLDKTVTSWEETYNYGIETLPGDWANPNPMSMANEQLLMLRLQTKEADLLAIPPVKHEKYLAIEDYDLFEKLDEIPELNHVLEKHEEHLITSISKEDGKEHVYGIQVSKLNHLQGVELLEDYIVSILTYPKNREQAIKLMAYILE